MHIARFTLCSRTKLFCCICWLRTCAKKCFHCLTCGPWYAAKCILQWADLRDNCSCPQCKKPFTRLLTYRTLDGTMSDFPVEESVCLLKRATWIQEQLKASHFSTECFTNPTAMKQLVWHGFACVHCFTFCIVCTQRSPTAQEADLPS